MRYLPPFVLIWPAGSSSGVPVRVRVRAGAITLIGLFITYAGIAGAAQVPGIVRRTDRSWPRDHPDRPVTRPGRLRPARRPCDHRRSSSASDPAAPAHAARRRHGPLDGSATAAASLQRAPAEEDEDEAADRGCRGSGHGQWPGQRREGGAGRSRTLARPDRRLGRRRDIPAAMPSAAPNSATFAPARGAGRRCRGDARRAGSAIPTTSPTPPTRRRPGIGSSTPCRR